MTTFATPTASQQSIAAFSDATGAASGVLQNDWADYASSMRESVGRPSRPQQSLPQSRTARIRIEEPAPQLLREVIAGVNELLALPRGWDSYGGKPISITAAVNLISWLDEMLAPGVPTPSVVPVSDGSIQLEWHVRGIDLEVLFSADRAPEFVYEDHDSATESEGDLSPLNQYGRIFIQELAARVDR